MRYILMDTVIYNIDDLRSKYQSEKKVDLSEKISMFGWPKKLGGTDVEGRRAQIEFLEKIYQVTVPYWIKHDPLTTPELKQNYLSTSRFLVSACLYVMDQIKSSKRNSVLYRLIEDALGITTENYLDEQDKYRYFSAAKRILNSSDGFDKYNTQLQDLGVSPFTEEEWESFKAFVEDSCKEYDNSQTTTSYPITSVTMPVFTVAFQTVGLTVGCMASDTLRTSTFIHGPKAKLTAGVVGGLLLIGNSPLSVAILSPVIVEKMLGFFCTISFAQLLSVTMGLVGKGIGASVGMPLDVAFKLSKKAVSTVSGLYFKDPSTPQLSGYFSDGSLALNGIQVKLVPQQKSQIQEIKDIVDMNQDGKTLINGVDADKYIESLQLPKQSLEELRSQLESITTVFNEDNEECNSEHRSLELH